MSLRSCLVRLPRRIAVATSLCAVLSIAPLGSTRVTAATPELLVYLVAGQSNADGRALKTDLPSQLQTPRADVPFYYRSYNYNTGVYSTLRPGSAGSPAAKNAAFGPEVTFGATLADWVAANRPADKIAIVKYAEGGTSLHTDWKAGGTATTNNDGAVYQTFQSTVTNGLSALHADATLSGYTLRIAGVIWVQGESDQADYANYAANLTTFIGDVRATYGAGIPFYLSALSDNRAANSGAGFDGLRAAQAQVDASVTGTYLINTDDAAYAIGSDGIHFNAAGQRALGNAFAQSVIASTIPEPASFSLLAGLCGFALSTRRKPRAPR